MNVNQPNSAPPQVGGWRNVNTPTIQQELARIDRISPTTRSGRKKLNKKKNKLARIITERAVAGGSKSAGSNRSRNTFSGSRPPAQRRPYAGTNQGNYKASSRRTPGMGYQDLHEYSEAEAARQYISAVLDPASWKGPPPRMPSRFPYPSSTITVTFEGTLATNSSGNLGLLFNPQMGYTGLWAEYLTIFNDNSFTTANNFIQTADTTCTHVLTDFISASMSQRHRVITAVLTAKYIGTQQNEGGLAAGCLMPQAPTRTVNVIKTGHSRDVVLDQYYSNETNNVREGLELVWIPRDDVDADYMTTGTGRETSYMYLLFQGLPVSNTCVAYNIKLMIEYIPTITNKISQIDVVNPNAAVVDAAIGMYNKVPHYVVSRPAPIDVGSQIENSLSSTSFEIGDWINSGVKVLGDFASGTTPLLNSGLAQSALSLMSALI